MLRSRLPVIAAGAAALLALGACSSSSSPSSSSSSSSTSSSESSTEAPPTTTAGTAFSAAGFTTVVPDQWQDETNNSADVSAISPASGTNGPTLALFNQPTGTAENDIGHISIHTAPQQVTPDQFGAYLATAGQNGATNLSQPQSFTLDGESGTYITYDVTQSDGSVFENQDMVVNHGADTYDIIYDVAQDQFSQLMPALQDVVSNWKWTS